MYSLLSVRSQKLDSAWHIVDTQYVVVGGVNECHTFLIYKIEQYLPVLVIYCCITMNPNGGSWWATVHRVTKKSDMTEATKHACNDLKNKN